MIQWNSDRSSKEHQTTICKLNTQECEQPACQIDLYNELQVGLNDISLGNTRPFAEAMADVKVKRSK